MPDSDTRYEIILPIRKVLLDDDSPNLVDTPFRLSWFLVGGPRQPVVQQQYNNWSPFRGGAWILPRIHLYPQSKAVAAANPNGTLADCGDYESSNLHSENAQANSERRFGLQLGRTDFGNQFVPHHRLRMPEIANCAQLSSLFDVSRQVRVLPEEPFSFHTFIARRHLPPPPTLGIFEGP